MRRDEQRLSDILEGLDRIARAVSGKTVLPDNSSVATNTVR
jgi:hypothetical protein